MDFPSRPDPEPNQTQHPPLQPLSKSKLPIKRKTLPLPPKPEPQSSFVPPPPILTPSKYHRVWTEPDEILFLEGLISASTTQGLSFPRDLPSFHAQFSQATSHRYTKSQLSEKLRRLRRKFRITSSRGLPPAHLSPHDSALFDLSQKLWGGGGAGCDCEEDNRQGDGEGEDWAAAAVRRSVARALEESFREVRRVVVCKGSPGFGELERRWREQRAAELDVFARRLRLVLDRSFSPHC